MVVFPTPVLPATKNTTSKPAHMNEADAGSSRTLSTGGRAEDTSKSRVATCEVQTSPVRLSTQNCNEGRSLALPWARKAAADNAARVRPDRIAPTKGHGRGGTRKVPRCTALERRVRQARSQHEEDSKRSARVRRARHIRLYTCKRVCLYGHRRKRARSKHLRFPPSAATRQTETHLHTVQQDARGGGCAAGPALAAGGRHTKASALHACTLPFF